MKRVLKRLTGGFAGLIPRGAWLSVAAGAAALFGWSMLREPVSTVVGMDAAATSREASGGEGFDSDQLAAPDLQPGGGLRTEPPDRAQHLFELDEATLRLRLRALSVGGDGACADPAAGVGALSSAPAGPIPEDADLRVSPRITGWHGDRNAEDPGCPPAVRMPFGAGDASGATEP